MLGTAAVMVLMLSSGAAAMVITTPHFRCVDIFRYIYKISTARPTSAGARARVWAVWW